MSLATPAISELGIESTALALFNEFLKAYFDGATHVVGSNASATFPTAVLLYQQAANPQPLNGVSIQQVMLHCGEPSKAWELSRPSAGTAHAVRMATIYARWIFFIRCQAQPTPEGNAARRVMLAGELLYGLLNNSMATRPLSEKGIMHLRPSPPELVSSGTGVIDNPGNDYAMRAVYCRAQLRYLIESQQFDKSAMPGSIPSSVVIPQPNVTNN